MNAKIRQHPCKGGEDVNFPPLILSKSEKIGRCSFDGCGAKVGIYFNNGAWFSKFHPFKTDSLWLPKGYRKIV